MTWDEMMVEQRKFYKTPEGRKEAVRIYAELYTSVQYINHLVEKMGCTHSGWKAGNITNVVVYDGGGAEIGRAYAHMRTIYVSSRKYRFHLEFLRDEVYLLKGKELSKQTFRRHKADSFISPQGEYGRSYCVYFDTPPVKPEMLQLFEECIEPVE